MSEREERFEEALQRLLHWSGVYSRDVFPEPDWEKAGELLKAAGISDSLAVMAEHRDDLQVRPPQAVRQAPPAQSDQHIP